jgi:hypothetical protein
MSFFFCFMLCTGMARHMRIVQQLVTESLIATLDTHMYTPNNFGMGTMEGDYLHVQGRMSNLLQCWEESI